MKILFDTDIGSDIDDALALLLLLRLPEVELVGVTTVYGCTDIRAKVAKKILDAAGCSVPVVAGQGIPFETTMPVWHAGTEGKSVLSANDMNAPLSEMGISEGADAFIAKAVRQYGDRLTILCLGALTNVAAAMRLDPGIRDRLGPLFFMGGGVTFRQPAPDTLLPGVCYRADPSHNVRCDVQAAREVFRAGVPMTVLTNDVTTRVWWDGESVQRLIHTTIRPEAVLVGRLLDVWLTYRSEIFERKVTGTCPHDPLTVAEAVKGGFVTYMQGRMEIGRDAASTFIVEPDGAHRTGVRVNAPGFLDWFNGVLA